MRFGKLTGEQVRYRLPLWISLLLIVGLLLLPTGFEGAIIYQGADHCAAKVLATNDTAIIDTGLIRSGEQNCTLELLGGKFKGKQVEGYNMLNGSLESDKIFKEGDRAMVVINYQGEDILSVNMIDHYRLDKELLLMAGFCIFIILFAGRTGVRAIISFVLTVLMIWRVLVPLYLRGAQPVFVGLGLVTVLTVLIISLVYGFDRRSLAACTGAISGLLVTCVLGASFTDLFQIHGAIMQSSEGLLYSGYQGLNLTQIFVASIFIGSSGAVMDLAVDITSSVNEVVSKKPGISWREATLSGVHVGRAAMGTMTTTLLLAYSGGYVALLMVFMAQGTPVYNILNYKYVASEIIDTMVGSFGLVTVAPLTALASGLLLTRRGGQSEQEREHLQDRELPKAEEKPSEDDTLSAGKEEENSPPL